MFDYHIHPNYSIDAVGTIDEFCEEALKRELKEIAFTTHLDTDPEGDDCYVNVGGKRVSTRSNIWLEDYEASIKAADDHYKAHGLRVRLGVEIDYIPEIDGSLPDGFHSTEFDLILGSMHLIDHIAISASGRAEAAFKKYDVEELGNKYYSLLQEAVDSGLFDILAHIDLYRRYGQKYYGDDIKSIWKPYFEDLTASMKRKRVGFEINTSSLRKGQIEPMPDANITKELLNQGIKIVTVGSDAHRPHDIGANITDAYDFLRSCGYAEIALFDSRNVRFFSIPIINH